MQLPFSALFSVKAPSPAGWIALSAWLWLLSPLLWMWANVQSLWQVVQSAILLMGVLLFRTSTRIACTLLWLLGFAFLSYFYAVHTLPDAFFWESLLNTNAQESWEYIRAYRPQDAALLLLWAIPALFAAMHLGKQPQILHSPKMRAFAWLTVVVWLLWFSALYHKKQDIYETMRRFKRIYPWMIVQSWESYRFNAAITLKPVALDPPTAQPMVDLLLVVFGESASAHRWSLLGYSGHPTNAALRPFANGLISLPLTASGNNTAKSLPVIISGQSLPTMHQGGVPSYLDYARAAGFESVVYANQNAPGFAYVAMRTRADRFVRIQDRSLDEALTPGLDAALQQYAASRTPTLITLHTYGSHPHVEKRYPGSAALWTDPYDNSIHYSSELLAQWISRLAALQQRVALIYVSDHGQDFPVCGGSYVHGITRSAYEVPFLLWASDTLRQQQPQWWKQWNAIASHAIDAQGIPRFHTMLVSVAIRQLLGYHVDLPDTASLPPGNGSYPPPETPAGCTNWSAQVQHLHPAASAESH